MILDCVHRWTGGPWHCGPGDGQEEVTARARAGPAPGDNSTFTFAVLSHPQHTAKICELYPSLEETNAIEAIIPKKSAGALAKWCVEGGKSGIYQWEVGVRAVS